MSSTPLFLAADPREFAGFITHWTSLTPLPLAVHWSQAGMWRGRPAKAIANGAGADRAFAAAVLAGEVPAICNLGFCGALDEALDIGDIVVATEVITHTGERHAAADPRGPEAAEGVIASINRIATTADEKRTLRATGAIAVEMEAAGAARAAEDLGVPFYCIRAVSDLATEDFANDFNAALTTDGSFSIARLVTGALASPSTRFRELVRLQKRTALASKKLGDFLAECRF
jgi:adenosylhomocysteine nucleosidase